MKQNQILAIDKSTKNRVNEKLTAIYKIFQKPDLFTGHVKTFTSRAENQDAANYEVLPDDRRHIQQHVGEALKVIREQQTEVFDLSYKKDVTNCLAKADVTVDGKVLLKDVPVTYLLWLGHQFDDLHTEVKKMPTLDAGEKWHHDAQQNCYATEANEQIRTKKVQTPLILAQATKEHPAQVKEITSDVTTGTWKTIKYSSAMPVDQKDAMLARVEKLQNAVKQAVEAANLTDVPPDLTSAGKVLFDFVYAK